MQLTFGDSDSFNFKCYIATLAEGQSGMLLCNPAQGYQRFPFSKPVVGRTKALHASEGRPGVSDASPLSYFWPILLTSFFLNLHFPKGELFVWLLFLFF